MQLHSCFYRVSQPAVMVCTFTSYRFSLSGPSWSRSGPENVMFTVVVLMNLTNEWTALNLVLLKFYTVTWPKYSCLHWECLPILPNWTWSGTELSLMLTWKFELYWYWKFVRRSTTGSKMPAGLYLPRPMCSVHALWHSLHCMSTEAKSV